MSATADRNLLFGILAVQLDFVTKDALIGAMNAWVLDKARLLGDILRDRGDLSADRLRLLDALVAEHLKQHGNDAQHSLAALSSVDPWVRGELRHLIDPDVQASLAHVGVAAADANGTVDLPPSVVSGGAGVRYRVLRPHARGGLGEVFVAEDTELHREVALKEIRAYYAADPASRDRFLLEAEVTGRLEHPGVVPVYGLGTYADGRPFYAMRFIHGDNLQQAIKRFHAGTPGRYDSLEFRQLLRRFIDVCNAVAYAHSRGVLHRDLKPANIMLGKYGETLVVDWGLAKAVGRSGGANDGEATLQPAAGSGSAATRAGQALGTPAYMSPEQAAGRLDELGPATDIYSLGATLYEVLTGRAAVAGDAGDVISRVQRGEFPPPRAVAASVPGALDAVCRKAMALQPSDRYQSALMLVSDLERWLADEPVSAHPEPWHARLRRWGRRHRVLVTGAAAAGLVALAGLAVVLWVQSRANRDLRAANERETARFDLAMDAIKLFHGEVSEDLLLKERQFDGLRTKLLRGAAVFYGKLEGLLEGQTDRRSRAALGQAYAELGELTKKIGFKPEALKVHRKALAVRRELAAEPGADLETKANVARILNASGYIQTEIGDWAGALASIEEARAILEALAAAHPDVFEFQRELAKSQYYIGFSLHAMSKPADALAAHGRAEAMYQRLTAARHDDTELQRDRVLNLNDTAASLWRLGRRPESLAALERMLAILKTLIAAHPDDAWFQRDLAFCYTNIGYHLEAKGTAEALATHEKARAIQQRLADAHPAINQFQSELAHSLGVISRFASTPAEALAGHEKARAIRQKLADAHPDVVEYQTELASSYWSIGVVLSRTDQPAEALAAHETARAIRQKLADAHPDGTTSTGGTYPARLAQSHRAVGDVLAAQGRWEEAAGSYQLALAIYEKSPNAYQSDLASIHSSIGLLLSNTGRPAEAMAAHEKALAIRQKRADARPDNTDFQQDLASSLSVIGLLLSDTGRQAEALAAHETARAIRRKLADARPDITSYQGSLASSHSRLGIAQHRGGRPADAVASFREAIAILERLPAPTPDNHYGLACYYARLAGVGGDAGSGLTAADAQAAADKAMDALRNAVAAGYRNVAQMLRDSDLDPLRRRADFADLLWDLADPPAK